jgi:hypothetical protein
MINYDNKNVMVMLLYYWLAELGHMYVLRE